MRRILVGCLGLLLITSDVRAAQAATTSRAATTQSLEQQLQAHKQEEQQKYLQELMALPELKLPNQSITDLVDVSVDKGMIAVRPKMKGTDGSMRCTIKGIEGPCQVSIFADKHSPDGAINAVQFMHRDFSNPTEIFRHTMLFAHAGAVQISTDLDGLLERKSMQLIESFDANTDPDEAVRLDAQVFDPTSDELIGTYKIAAPSFREMRRKYPRETQAFVVPILRDLQLQQ